MRIAIVLIIGLLAGALGGIKAYQSFSAGSEVPHAVMWMMRYHFGAVGDAIKAGQCGPEAVGSHIDTLARMADDIEPVFLPMGDDLDAPFSEHAKALRDGIQQMQSAVGSDCKGLAAARGETFEACKACHRDFK
ncbi:MAG: cytochrome c [Rhodanobacteraceae bacterium]|nr:cytochrome c [Xanthomonadales bacterium]MCP5478404.1 cytochrome c [Rhodanobacteraceae bacterium]HPF74168.1 cytochrome c [Xanthomonadaceae bacterium]HRX99292.1 cytochrome c [Xanthomonadaceae bacterium]